MEVVRGYSVVSTQEHRPVLTQLVVWHAARWLSWLFGSWQRGDA